MNYSLKYHLEKVYSNFPEGKDKPVIGLTSNHHEIDADIRERYYQQIVASGGVPVIIPPVADADVIIKTLDSIDALILTGGADIDPRWMNEEHSPLLGNVNEVRDLPELLTTVLAYNRQIPILGICRGMQTLAIALGGHVAQDLSLDANKTSSPEINHSQEPERDVRTHGIRIDSGSTLYNIYKSESLMVNSFHHQSVDKTGNLFRAVAWSEDGVVEAMESTEHKSIIGVQWHPEWLEEEGRKIFHWLVKEAEVFKTAKQLHASFITIDSHCDTPMFFPQGADFSKRDSRLLVDIHKMTDGRLDTATMVAYIPQPVNNQTWYDVAPLPADSPTEYANLIFDRIEAIVNRNSDIVGIAHNHNELLENKRQGKKSIMLGIENALALGNDLSLVKHFKNRGAKYFTLCHNGDNQICDSARRSVSTWGGVSDFGAEVIKEMNRHNVTVDLSHAGEHSFYDALNISEKPVVCSHSNCKAICGHKRNITDDQLRALARKGGVCQLTLYDGFISNNPKEADIHEFMKHVVHAVNIMGIDHVGIGTDFDGDGGIRGLKDSSELIQFTMQLLKHHFSYEDIEKIWGGNWLRVI